MPLTAEEQAALSREAARCRAEKTRLLSLVGDPERARETEQGFEPLRRHPPLPEVVCRLPYDAPELLP